ncbi:hypothetical protein V5799_031139 [Amblyomma americanum]|uniref:BEN domain-containing protein n=1 Tax=Amblyomma americanum TaxID=6943 RepID=A0AAQ4ELC8_AMBAM
MESCASRDDRDDKLHVVGVNDIDGFEPKDTKDFDNKAIYSVFWVDTKPGSDDTGFYYKAQVLLLAERREDIEERQKRVLKPKIRPEECSDEENQKKKEKQILHKKKQLKVAAKKTRYADILHKHLADAHNKIGAMRSEDQKHKKRRLEVSTSSSSGDDESLCSSSELRQAIASKNRWKEKALKLEAREHFLQNQITSLQRCLESKIFHLSGELPQAVPESCETAVNEASSVHALPAGVQASTEQQLQQNIPERASASVAKQNSAALLQPSNVPEDFTHLADGSFHLSKGIVISEANALKILRARKPTLVCKDTAQAIWTSDVLAERSLSGNIAPGKRGLGEQPRQPLTPMKVDVVAETVRYWGRQKGVDVEQTVAAVPKLLSEKIQDIRKTFKRQK